MYEPSLMIESNLLVQAVRDKDEEALERSDQSHKNKKDDPKNFDVCEDGV